MANETPLLSPGNHSSTHLSTTLQRQFAAFLIAVQFLTRVPVPADLSGRGPHSTLLRASVIYFPLVGALVGLATATVILCASDLWSLGVAVLIGLACEALLTGALHEDAVADFCDAFGGGWTREDILRILKDSRVGSFGVVGLTLAIFLRAGALASIEPSWLLPVIVASATLGRWVILFVMTILPPVPDRASLARDVGQQIRVSELALGSLFAVPGIVVWAFAFPLASVVGVFVLLAIAVGFVRYVRRRIGGVTGDCLGFICYVSQVLVLLTATAR